MNHSDADRSDASIPLLDDPLLADTSAADQYFQPPRLGIIHLLAWTAATAVLLKLWMAVDMLRGTDAGSMGQAAEVFQQASRIIYNTVLGAGIVGTGVVLLGKLRGAPGRLQPGHWLLTIETLATLLTLLCWLSYTLLLEKRSELDYSPTTFVWLLVYLGIKKLLQAVAYFVVTGLVRDALRWRVALFAMGVGVAIEGLAYICMAFWLELWWLVSFPLGQFIAGAVLLVTVLLDLPARRLRDWVHWLGVALIATFVGMWIAWWAFSLILPG